MRTCFERKLFFLSILQTALVVGCKPSTYQTKLSIRIYDEENGQPITKALFQLNDNDTSESDSNGQAEFIFEHLGKGERGLSLLRQDGLQRHVIETRRITLAPVSEMSEIFVLKGESLKASVPAEKEIKNKNPVGTQPDFPMIADLRFESDPIQLEIFPDYNASYPSLRVGKQQSTNRSLYILANGQPLPDAKILQRPIQGTSKTLCISSKAGRCFLEENDNYDLSDPLVIIHPSYSPSLVAPEDLKANRPLVIDMKPKGQELARVRVCEGPYFCSVLKNSFFETEDGQKIKTDTFGYSFNASSPSSFSTDQSEIVRLHTQKLSDGLKLKLNILFQGISGNFGFLREKGLSPYVERLSSLTKKFPQLRHKMAELLLVQDEADLSLSFLLTMKKDSLWWVVDLQTPDGLVLSSLSAPTQQLEESLEKWLKRLLDARTESRQSQLSLRVSGEKGEPLAGVRVFQEQEFLGISDENGQIRLSEIASTPDSHIDSAISLIKSSYDPAETYLKDLPIEIVLKPSPLLIELENTVAESAQIIVDFAPRIHTVARQDLDHSLLTLQKGDLLSIYRLAELSSSDGYVFLSSSCSASPLSRMIEGFICPSQTRQAEPIQSEKAPKPELSLLETKAKETLFLQKSYKMAAQLFFELGESAQSLPSYARRRPLLESYELLALALAYGSKEHDSAYGEQLKHQLSEIDKRILKHRPRYLSYLQGLLEDDRDVVAEKKLAPRF